MPIQSLSHITFIVRDLDRTEEILTKILDAKKVYDSGEKLSPRSKDRFFLIGELWIAIIEGEPLPSRTYNHVAFKIDEADYDNCLAKIRGLGLDIRESRPRIDGEARSIYFHDYDNHLLELHTGTLAARLAAYAASPPH